MKTKMNSIPISTIKPVAQTLTVPVLMLHTYPQYAYQSTGPFTKSSPLQITIPSTVPSLKFYLDTTNPGRAYSDKFTVTAMLPKGQISMQVAFYAMVNSFSLLGHSYSSLSNQ